jgi:hypothetical protein
MIIDKPVMYNESIAIYLKQLQESGRTNMFLAAPFLEREFKLTQKDSIECLLYWVSTFEGD